VERGKEGEQIQTFHDILWARVKPGFLKGGGGLEMAGARRDGGDENAHGAERL
jgi:hypothetical protein